MAPTATLLACLAGCSLLALAVASPVIQPRPVNNKKDPRDGEIFEWQPVDDDPWPGPSFTFPANLPGLDSFQDGQPSPSPAQLQVALQFMRALFGGVFTTNPNRSHAATLRNKPVSSNEVENSPSQQKQNNKRFVRNWSPLTHRR